MSVALTKERVVVEDMELSLEVSIEQSRGVVTPFNAAYLPYTTGISVGQALLDRYTKTEADTNFALIGGDSLQTFLVGVATGPTEAVQKSQLDLKADQTDVDLKADKTNVLELDNNDAFTPIADYQPATKRFVDDSITTKFQAGVSGSFTAASGETVTVTGGLITGII